MREKLVPFASRTRTGKNKRGSGISHLGQGTSVQCSNKVDKTEDVMISYLALFFSLGLLFLFTNNTFVFTNCPILSYDYSSLVIMITSPSNVIA